MVEFDGLMDAAREIQRKALELAESQWIDKHKGGRNAVPPLPAGERDRYKYIPEWYRVFAEMPDDKLYENEIAHLRQAAFYLSNGFKDEKAGESYAANVELDELKTASSYLTDWTGTAAENFKETFLDPFDSVSANQFFLIGTLQWALQAQQAVWHHAREGICKVAQATLDGLDHKSCDPASWNITFTVLSSLAAITVTVLAPPVGAAMDAAVLTHIAVAGAVAQSVAVFPPGDGPAIPYEPGAITKAMKDKMIELVGDINKAERQITDGLNAMLDAVVRYNHLYTLKRPDLANQTTKELTSEDGLGHTM